MSCHCDPPGVLQNQEYGYTEIPDGAIAVQRCDQCNRYEGDLDAAIALAVIWGTGFDYLDDGEGNIAELYPDDMDPDGVPSDVWVFTKEGWEAERSLLEALTP